MSNTKREPLLSDEKMEAMLLSNVVCKRVADDKMQSEATGYGLAMGGGIVREVYEAARAKDAELIQRLIHEGNAMAALIEVNEPFIENDVRRSHWHSHRVSWMAANDAAEAAGFKPTKP